MELSPESVASATFKIVKKGCDPDQVKAYLIQLASALDTSQKHAAAMEARARAATSRLQEIASQPAPSSTPVAVDNDAASDNIGRTLLLAQKTADATLSEATLEATHITMRAKVEAQVLVDSAQGMLNRLLDDAKAEARQSAEGERLQIESEVRSLAAQREFLLSDIGQLEQHIVTQRERLLDVAGELNDIADRVPGGLADLGRPILLAGSDGEQLDDDSGIDASLEWARPNSEPAALGSGDEQSPVPMLAVEHSDALVSTASVPSVLDGHLDETKEMPRVQLDPMDDLLTGVDEPS